MKNAWKKAWNAWKKAWNAYRDWFAAQPKFIRWPVFALLLVGMFALPNLAEIPIIGPQIITTHYDWSTALFEITDGKPYYWLGLSVVIVVVFAIRNLDRSRVGRSWLAIREDEEAAEVMGVRTVKYKLWAFAIGAFIAGISRVLFAGESIFV